LSILLHRPKLRFAYFRVVSCNSKILPPYKWVKLMSPNPEANKSIFRANVGKTLTLRSKQNLPAALHRLSRLRASLGSNSAQHLRNKTNNVNSRQITVRVRASRRANHDSLLTLA
jgi:hypothetical protein